MGIRRAAARDEPQKNPRAVQGFYDYRLKAFRLDLLHDAYGFRARRLQIRALPGSVWVSGGLGV